MFDARATTGAEVMVGETRIVLYLGTLVRITNSILIADTTLFALNVHLNGHPVALQ